MDKRIKISIIVPVYNVEDYIEQCIDSLIGQTLKEIEVILVNDGSSDRSGQILDEYKEKYPEKIVIIHKENSGPGDSRNKGMEIARGEYIGFADSDDWVAPDMYEKLYTMAKKGYDVVVCDLMRVNEDGEKRVLCPYEGKVPSNQKEFVLNSFNNVAPWNKIYKKDIVKELKYPSYWYEDFGFTPVAVAKSTRMGYLPEALYYYRVVNTSVTASDKSLKIKDIIKACEYAIQNVDTAYYEEFMYSVLMRLYRYTFEKWYFKDIFIEFMKKYEGEFRRNNYLKKEIRNNNIISCLMTELVPKKVHYINLKNENNIKNIDVKGTELEGYEIIEWKLKDLKNYINDIETKLGHKCTDEFLNNYLKLIILQEHGGFAIDFDMKINTYLGSLRIYDSVFCFDSNDTIHSKFIASQSNSKILKQIIEEIESQFRYKKVISVENIIKDILQEIYNLNLNGQRQYLVENISVLSPREAFYNLLDGKNLVEKIQQLNLEKELKDTYIQDAFNYINNEILVQDALLNELKNENEKLKREVFVYKNSNSWKITQPLRKVGDILKKIK